LKMRFSTVVAALVPVAAVSAQQNYTIIVGGNGTLTFNPASVNATAGDTIAFQFQSKNHTATQSSFAAPCMNLTTPTAGIDSGFMPVAPNATSYPQWSFTVTNATSPLWFYCRQTGHCQNGMVFAVNPNANKSLAAFQAAAKASNSDGTPGSSGASTSSASSASSTTASSKPSASSTGGAMRQSGSAAVALAVVGVAAGVLL
jgi:plastocyanin